MSSKCSSFSKVDKKNLRVTVLVHPRMQQIVVIDHKPHRIPASLNAMNVGAGSRVQGKF